MTNIYNRLFFGFFLNNFFKLFFGLKFFAPLIIFFFFWVHRYLKKYQYETRIPIKKMKQEKKNFNKIEKIIFYMIQIVNLKLLSMFHIKFKVFRKVSSKPIL